MSARLAKDGRGPPQLRATGLATCPYMSRFYPRQKRVGASATNGYAFPEMTTVDETWSTVFAALERLRDRWPDAAWTYDRRLKCVASSFPVAREAEARAAMTESLPQSWSAASLSGAPAAVLALAESCGGLRASQLLFWGGEPDGAGLFGLWWPWGDGTTVSLRIGLHGVDLPKERYPRLRDVFGIPQAPPAG